MRQLQSHIQDESLKKMDLIAEEAAALQQFDVTDQVMDRIYSIQSRVVNTQQSSNRHMRTGRALSPALTIALVVVGLSLTGAAASQYLEFRDNSGRTTLITANPTPQTEMQQTYTQKLNGYVDQVKQKLKPGEYAAYYVKDDLINEMDSDQPIKFAYKQEEQSSFADLLQEIQKTGAPSLNRITDLPEGYAFDYGYVYPMALFPTESQNQTYPDLKKELLQAASTAPEGETLFIKKLNWTAADFTLARYNKGTDFITVTIREVSPNSTLTLFQNDTDSAEKLSIQGTEAFFIQTESDGGSSSEANSRHNWLGWKDDNKHLLYEIYDNPGSSLTKADLVKIAEDLLTSSY